MKQRKQITVLLLGIVLFVALGSFIFLTGQQISVQASQINEREDFVVLPTVSASTTTRAGDSVNILEGERVLLELQTLVENSKTVLLQPGWLHITALTQNTIPSQGTLPNGDIIPQDYVLDDWYLLDQNGQVTQAVTFMRDEEGEIVQNSVLYDGNWHNLTLNDVSPAMPFIPSLDYGFFDRAVQHPAALSRANTSLDSKQAVVYILSTYLETPVLLAGSNVASKGMVEKIYFDLDTDAVLKIEIFNVSESGEEILDHATTIITREHLSEPSDEVAKILEEIKK